MERGQQSWSRQEVLERHNQLMDHMSTTGEGAAELPLTSSAFCLTGLPPGLSAVEGMRI